MGGTEKGYGPPIPHPTTPLPHLYPVHFYGNGREMGEAAESVKENIGLNQCSSVDALRPSRHGVMN